MLTGGSTINLGAIYFSGGTLVGSTYTIASSTTAGATIDISVTSSITLNGHNADILDLNDGADNTSLTIGSLTSPVNLVLLEAGSNPSGYLRNTETAGVLTFNGGITSGGTATGTAVMNIAAGAGTAGTLSPASTISTASLATARAR